MSSLVCSYVSSSPRLPRRSVNVCLVQDIKQSQDSRMKNSHSSPLASSLHWSQQQQGSHTECQYKLMTFGVPVSHFPVGYEKGELKTAAHLRWLARRVVIETALQSTGRFEGIDLPCSRDVLLGRGKTIQDHSGNVMLRDLIAEYMPEYRSTAKKEKGNVAWKVVRATKMQGGRFLKREPNGWWVEVPDEIARNKIAMTYRTSRPSSSSSPSNMPPTDMFLEPPLKRSKKDEVGRRRESSQQEALHDEEGGGVVDYSSSGGRNRSSLSSTSAYKDFCLGA